MDLKTIQGSLTNFEIVALDSIPQYEGQKAWTQPAWKKEFLHLDHLEAML